MILFLERLGRLRTLPPPERHILFVAAAWLPCISVGLRVLGLRRLQACLGHGVSAPKAHALTHAQILRTGELVNIASRYTVFPPTCLIRSLLLEWMLRRRGVDAEMRIGVCLAGRALDAHAWVEHAGVPINDRPDVADDFLPFREPISDRAFVSR